MAIPKNICVVAVSFYGVGTTQYTIRKEWVNHMKKIRVLALILVVLMLPVATLFSCNKETDPCANGEHNFPTKWVVDQRRTCTTPEIESRTCRDCGYKETRESKPATGHSFDESKKVFNNDATCTTDGNTINTCMYCNYTVIEAMPGSAYGHVYLNYTSSEDGYTEFAYCVRCNERAERLRGLKLDMEGDRSHLSYQNMSVYTAGIEGAWEYITEDGRTYLRVSRPEGDIVGSSEFGIILKPRSDILREGKYVFEITVKGNETTGDVNLLTGIKESFNQKITFVSYDSANGKINSVYGPVYDLTDEDKTNGFTVAVVLDDNKLIYDIYVNNRLVASGLDYPVDYYPGNALSEYRITMAAGNTASSFDVDSIYLYMGDTPKAYDGEVLKGYDVFVTESGEKIMYKLPVESEGHSHVYTNPQVVAPTCSKSGYTISTCSCGGQQITAVVAPMEHVWDEGVIVPPTCLENGYVIKTCQLCGIKDAEQNAPATGHTLPADAQVTAPTCTEDGFTAGNCVDCGTYFVDESTRVPALGHALGSEGNTIVQSSCESEGYIEGKCIRCGETYKDPTTVIPAKGHTCFDPEVIAPTCDADGYDKCVCLVCNKEYQENVVKATGHKLYSTVSDKTVTTKCLNCDYIDSYTMSDSAPSETDMDKLIGEGNKIKSYPIDSAFKTAGELTNKNNKDAHDGIVARFATYTHAKDTAANNDYVVITTAAGTSNDKDYHNYWDFGGGKTTANKDIVMEINLRLPKGTTNYAYMQMEALERVTKSPNTTQVVATDSTGKILCQGAEIGSLSADKWTKIAVVMNFSSGTTYDVYVDGQKKVSGAQITIAFARLVECFRINFRRIAEGQASIEVDSLYLYYGSRPVYLSGITAPEDSSKIDFTDGENKTIAESYTEPEAAAHETANYVKQLAGKFSIIYKQNASFLFKAIPQDDTSYNVLNLKYEKGVITTAYGNSSGVDTHMLVYGLPTAGVINASTEIIFNEITGKVTIFQGRREFRPAGATKNSQTQRAFVVFDNGKLINDLTGDVIYEVEKGERVRIDIVDNTTSCSLDIYVNGILYVENCSYASTDYGKVTVAAFGYKMFNVSDAGKIDIDIVDIDMYPGVTVPDNYAGRIVADKVVDGKEETIVSFDENFDIKTYTGFNSDRIAGSFFYKTVSGQSYLEIVKIADDVKLLGNLRVVKIGVDGNELADTTQPGYWTLASSDFATNGLPTYLFDSFPGVPQNAETGNYDFSGYKAIKYRFYIPNGMNYKFMITVYSPNNTKPDGTNPGISYYSRELVFDTPGWKTVEYDLSSLSKGERQPSLSNIVSVRAEFSGWNNGVNKKVVDGFSFYLESIKLIKADEKLADTSYRVEGTLCAEHQFGEPVTVAPTCTSYGYSYKECQVCKYKEVTGPVDYAEHTFDPEQEERVEATCERDGYIEQYCTVCQKTYKTVLPATGHNYVLSEELTAESGKQPTCTEEGLLIYVCDNEGCNHAGKEFRYTAPAVGHTPAEGAETVVVPPTCTEDGYTLVKGCANCGVAEYKTNIVAATGHQLVEDKVDATCTEDGKITVKCSVCGYVESETVIPAKGHSRPANYLITVIDRSCETYAGIKYNCRVCGEETAEYDYDGGKDAHTWGEWYHVSDPTCGTPGMRDKKCLVCGKLMSEDGTEEEKALCEYQNPTGQHTWVKDKYSSDNEYEVRIKFDECSVCNAKTNIVEIPAKYDGTEGLIFTDNGKGQYVITGYKGTATEIVIPATYSGKPVIIGSAFAGNTKITSVVIPNGVTIAAGAFKDCTALTSVTLPEDLEYIPQSAFENCTALKNIVLPKSVTSIYTAAFAGCTALETVEIRGELEEVQQFAFNGCTGLTKVYYVVAEIPDNIAAQGNDKLISANWVVKAAEGTEEAAA